MCSSMTLFSQFYLRSFFIIKSSITSTRLVVEAEVVGEFKASWIAPVVESVIVDHNELDITGLWMTNVAKLNNLCIVLSIASR